MTFWFVRGTVCRWEARKSALVKSSKRTLIKLRKHSIRLVSLLFSVTNYNANIIAQFCREYSLWAIPHFGDRIYGGGEREGGIYSTMDEVMDEYVHKDMEKKGGVR